jgi:esterase/lipase superfamily enzyme
MISAVVLSLALSVAPLGGGGHGVRPDTVRDTTFYVTNRARSGAKFNRAPADSLEFGIAVTRFVVTASALSGGHLTESLSGVVTDTIRMSRRDFVSHLSDAYRAAGADRSAPVLYVHGYATSFGRGVTQVAEISHRVAGAGPFIVFTWPAHTAMATWPSVRSVISRAYRQDSASAANSVGAFREALAVVISTIPSSSLSIVGHSLGAQLVAEALHQPSAMQNALTEAPLRSLVFFAPDIPAARMRDSLASSLSALAVRRVVYASRADRMLKLSSFVNHAARTGQVRADQGLGGFEVVDVSDGVRQVSGVRRLYDPQHAMRYAAAALYDFAGVISGRSPDCRVTQQMAAPTSEGGWRLTRAAIPDAAASCH